MKKSMKEGEKNVCKALFAPLLYCIWSHGEKTSAGQNATVSHTVVQLYQAEKQSDPEQERAPEKVFFLMFIPWHTFLMAATCKWRKCILHYI